MKALQVFVPVMALISCHDLDRRVGHFGECTGQRLVSSTRMASDVLTVCRCRCVTLLTRSRLRSPPCDEKLNRSPVEVLALVRSRTDAPLVGDARGSFETASTGRPLRDGEHMIALAPPWARSMCSVSARTLTTSRSVAAARCSNWPHAETLPCRPWCLPRRGNVGVRPRRPGHTSSQRRPSLCSTCPRADCRSTGARPSQHSKIWAGFINPICCSSRGLTTPTKIIG